MLSSSTIDLLVKYLYTQVIAPNVNAANKNPAAAMKRRIPIGIHIGAVMKIKGVKKIKPSIIVVIVTPVRRSKIPPEITRVKKPMSWVELGT